jgi:hypothetical protein
LPAPAANQTWCYARTLADYLVNQAAPLGGRIVALGVVLDLFQRLAGALGQDLVQALAGLEDFAGMDLDFGRLTRAPPRGW